MNIDTLYQHAVELLKNLIATPSFSREEEKTALLIEQFFRARGIVPSGTGNNIFVRNRFYDESKPTILLNSHHDTVRPNPGYTRDPFDPAEQEGKLFGLGSNDAGGCLVSLVAAFLFFYEKEDLKYNLLMAASAEEEISGPNGIESLLPHLGKIDFGIVGEPTGMQLAVAEKGLLVIDCISTGRAGHAASHEGENAIYNAIEDINWLRNYIFERISPLTGACKFSVTAIETTNKQHNVVPAECSFILDVRVNELYPFDEILALLDANLKSRCTPRSTRIKSTSISVDHPLVQAGIKLGKTCYGSPTTSDKALMPFPALKIGPGDSSRSHSADEYIFLEQIREGIDTYIKILEQLLYHQK